jgi:manganese-dependent inorganic pyrophosphatase
MPYTVTERLEFWDPAVTYVIGHQRPDTDAIAAALGYAWLLQETGGDHIRAARTGQPGEQTTYALKRFEQAAPTLLTAVAPTFHHVAEKRVTVKPDAPLSEALALLGNGEQMVPIVNGDQKPMGVVTPLALARAYSRSLGDDGKRNKSVEPTCGELSENAPTYRERDRISDHRNALLRADSNQFLVIDENGLYLGIASQRRLLQPPRARLILVDHNELSQAVAGAEEAEIVAVLDHHRLGNPPTAAPIPFVVDPVGSTSTLVAEQCRMKRKTPPRSIAGMLLSGILSDTLVFRSPTTSDRDKEIADWLSGVCRIDVQLYGRELLSAAPGLGSRTADDIIDGDRKTYEMSGLTISIGQVEVTGMQELPDRRDEILAVMRERIQRENLQLICLMVTDVVTGHSILLCEGDTHLTAELPFARTRDHQFDLGDIVSRKKQLAPAVQNAIEMAL